MNRIIVPVIGMHRSGTSAVAGALHSGGVLMGNERSFRPAPGPENPKGFFEDFRFRRLNDHILNKQGYDVKSWKPDIPEIIDDRFLRSRRRRLLRKCDRGGTMWGWKDPRTSLTLNLWLSDLRELEMIERTRIVLVQRHPLSIARSLRTRNGIGLEQGLHLWLAYSSRVLDLVKLHGLSVFSLNYEALLEKPEELLRQLHSFLGGLFDVDKGSAFIDTGLQRSGPGSGGMEELKESEAGAEVLDLYDRLVKI